MGGETMKSHHPKLILLSVIFLAASAMYWSLFNNFILKNTQPEAAAGKVEVSFLEDTVTVANPDTDLIDVNVFFTSTELVQKGTISFQYSRELQYMHPIVGRDVISAVCSANGFTHTQLLNVQFDNAVGGGHIAREVPTANAAGGAGGAIPTGFFCHTTLTFMSKPGGLLAQSGRASINLWDPADPACAVGGGVVGGGVATGNLCTWLLTDPAGAVHTPVMSPTRNMVNVIVAGGGHPTLTPDPAIDMNVTPTGANMINPTSAFMPTAAPNSGVSCVTRADCPAFNCIQAPCQVYQCIVGQCVLVDPISPTHGPTPTVLPTRIPTAISVNNPTVTPAANAASPTRAPFACNQCPLGINYCAVGPGSDFELLQQCIFGTAGAAVNCMRFDINGDGVVNAADLSAFSTCNTCNCASVPTQAPTSTTVISPTAVSNNCPRRPQGDLNCDGAVDLVDFNKWRIAFIAYLQSGVIDKNADISGDGKPTLPDFEIIRTNLQLN